MQGRFSKDLEHLNAYNNIRKSMMHRITCRFSIIPCAEFIEWNITHMDDLHLTLQSESRNQLSTYYSEYMQTYYKMIKPN